MKVNVVSIVLGIFLFSACAEKPSADKNMLNQVPEIEPDYTEITIPVNIAPLNFDVKEKGEVFFVEIKGENGSPVEITSNNGTIQIPEKSWKKLLKENNNGTLNYTVFVKNEGKWNQYTSFSNKVSDKPVDHYLYYRLLFPGYESWTEISIMQRDLESFSEKPVIQNNVVDQNCVNCHAFNQQNTDDFMFHMRGSMGGTYFVTNGELEKVNIKTEEMKNGAVYPRWHPSGKYVAFSSNKVVQQFHSMKNKKIEVSDLESSLILYDREKNEVMDIPVDKEHRFMDTYPEWSPDGKFLYFCRAAQISEGYNYEDTKYNLCRVSFDPVSRKFGESELIFDAEAIGKSVSFPRISPDGKSLVFTLHDYGCFPIWHKEADLYAVNTETLETEKLDVNSDFTESYHSWSSNGRWLVFSSKRLDGLSARPFIAYIDENGKAGKPFILPQEDPEFYNEFLKTFNIPEFSQREVSLDPGEIRKVAAEPAIQAKWAAN